jgi:hypothetical protein
MILSRPRSRREASGELLTVDVDYGLSIDYEWYNHTTLR